MFMLLLFLCTFLVLPENEAFNRVYYTPQNIEAQGYVAETHHVTTRDGYILEMHRIPYARNQKSGTQNRPVVFMMHGLTAASNSFIILGSEYAIAYNLADAGFDVWMGNARGTKNSRYHVTMDPDNRDDHMNFFDFTWEEIGIIDVPAMIDYALNYTKQNQLHYIGHSQGGTVFLVMASLKPEYNAKIASAHLLAGVGYQNYFPNVMLATLATMTDYIYNLAMLMRLIELYPPNSTEMVTLPIGQRSPYINALCFGAEKYKYLCDVLGVQNFMFRLNTDDEMDELINLRGGASLKQVAHYGQNIRDKKFRRWNYNTTMNIQIYGAPEPPIYNLSLITINTTMHYSLNDSLLDERDVLDMVHDMPNAEARKVSRVSFLHEDFVAAIDSKELVNNYIVQAINYVHQANLPDDPTTEIPYEEPSTDFATSNTLNAIFKCYFLFILLQLCTSIK